MPKLSSHLPLLALALAIPAAAQAQNYADLPPLAPMSQAELRTLPTDMRAAPAPVPGPSYARVDETVSTVNGVETITRTRRIDAPRGLPAAPMGPHHGYSPHAHVPQTYHVPMAYAPAAAPVVFERSQWIDECRRRIKGRNRDDTGLIIGGLLGALGGGFAGYEIAGAGDRVLGTVLGAGGGGLIGGLIGSLFGNGKKRDREYCETALDSYLSQSGGFDPRIANREIGYAGYGYTYAPPQQMVVVPVRTEVQQQVVVRETERYETYTVPGSSRVIPPAPRPSPKMIKTGRR